MRKGGLAIRKSHDFQVIIDYLNEEVRMGLLPGAVIAIGDSNSIFFKESVGFSTVFPDCRFMTNETIFDIASLTKVVGTLTSIMILVEKDQLSLFQKVSEIFDVFKGTAVENISIFHLLTHTSGLPLKMDFTRDYLSQEDIIEYISHAELEFKTGTKVLYSDLGFILLGFIIEKISGDGLDIFMEREIFQPLNMKNTRYTPPLELKTRCAVTEYRRFLNRYQWGEVHDRTARALGGISGHAGLFSTVEDLSNFALCYLNRGSFQNKQLLQTNSILQMTTNQTSNLNKARGIGWEIYESGKDSFAGGFHTDSFGHTGFTGTSLALNLSSNFFVILLTNRIHYGRRDDIMYIRENVHRLVGKILDR